MKHYAVIILNWNGADDTIDCLRSIFESETEAIPIIVDNGSTDGSVDAILDYIEGGGYKLAEGSLDELIKKPPEPKECKSILIKGTENLGFAGGCNLGLRLAQACKLDLCVFLNNDTLVGVRALSKLVGRLRVDKSYFATLPLLTIHGTGRVWNCGGVISRLGFRRYHYSDTPINSVPADSEIRCSFFTGCCFAVRTSEFAARGGFSERFFFGEEDFELALWMRDHGLRALCLTESVVHHKVSSSVTRAAAGVQASKVFVHYLNRFTHMRLRLGTVLWMFWLMGYVPYVAMLLLRRKILSLTQLPSFLGSLIARAWRRSTVTRDDFETIMRGGVW